MKGIFMRLLAISILWLLASGCAITAHDQQQKQRLELLETKNLELQQKNLELLAQNKRFKKLIEDVLRKFQEIQKQRENLVTENMELYKKLYSERLVEQQASIREREQHLKDLEKEAQQLMQQVVDNKDNLRQVINKHREQLIEFNLWTIEDERLLSELLEEMDKNLSPQQEQKMLQKAIKFEEQLRTRLQQSPPIGENDDFE